MIMPRISAAHPGLVALIAGLVFRDDDIQGRFVRVCPLASRSVCDCRPRYVFRDLAVVPRNGSERIRMCARRSPGFVITASPFGGFVA
jgi:hypothetical protein